jgi:phosphoribosyl 1,2-cyclic phosphate phosphodiesterase
MSTLITPTASMSCGWLRSTCAGASLPSPTLRPPTCCEAPPGSEYPPIVTLGRLVAGQPIVIDGKGGPIEAVPFTVLHGNMAVLGFRIGDVAYTPDISSLNDGSHRWLADLDLWIVDALRDTPHPSHFTVAEALAWIERLKPRRAILTNMHVDLDYATLRRTLPAGVEPAYDGLSIRIGEG